MRVLVIALLVCAAAAAHSAPRVWLEYSDVPEVLMVSNDTGAEIRGCIVEWKVSLEKGRHYTEIAMVDLPANGETKVTDCGDWWDENASKTLDVSLKLLGPDKKVLAEEEYTGTFRVVPRVGIPTDGWRARASRGEGNAGKAFDGDQGSRWDTGGKQEGGDWYLLDMGNAHRISGLIIDARRSGNDYPEGLAVDVSAWGEDWERVVDLEDTTDVNQRGRIKLSFDPVEVQHILITLTKLHGDNWFWSIHELSVLPAEGD